MLWDLIRSYLILCLAQAEPVKLNGISVLLCLNPRPGGPPAPGPPGMLLSAHCVLVLCVFVDPIMIFLGFEV